MYRGKERCLKRRASPRTPRRAQVSPLPYPKASTTKARQGPAQFELDDDDPSPVDPLDDLPDPPEEGWYPENVWD